MRVKLNDNLLRRMHSGFIDLANPLSRLHCIGPYTHQNWLFGTLFLGVTYYIKKIWTHSLSLKLNVTVLTLESLMGESSGGSLSSPAGNRTGDTRT